MQAASLEDPWNNWPEFKVEYEYVTDDDEEEEGEEEAE